MTTKREAMTQKIKRMRAVADGLRRIQEFESARYLDEYADVLTAKALDANEAENYRDDWFDSNTGRDCQRTRVAPAIGDTHLSRAAEPVYQQQIAYGRWIDLDAEGYERVAARYPDRVRILYTHPPDPARDAKDAARYRWLAEHEDADLYMENPGKEQLDRAIDAAMAQESGE